MDKVWLGLRKDDGLGLVTTLLTFVDHDCHGYINKHMFKVWE